MLEIVVNRKLNFYVLNPSNFCEIRIVTSRSTVPLPKDAIYEAILPLRHDAQATQRLSFFKLENGHSIIDHNPHQEPEISHQNLGSSFSRPKSTEYPLGLTRGERPVEYPGVPQLA